MTAHWAKERYSTRTSRPLFSSLRNSRTHLCRAADRVQVNWVLIFYIDATNRFIRLPVFILDHTLEQPVRLQNGTQIILFGLFSEVTLAVPHKVHTFATYKGAVEKNLSITFACGKYKLILNSSITKPFNERLSSICFHDIDR